MTVRHEKATLAQWDLRASQADLLTLPAGDVGMAIGAELRRDSYLDDRDERVDGTMTWTDSVTGFEPPSDLFGVSPTPDTKGSRPVFAAYAELAVTLNAPVMNTPFVCSLKLTLEGRTQHIYHFS